MNMRTIFSLLCVVFMALVLASCSEDPGQTSGADDNMVACGDGTCHVSEVGGVCEADCIPGEPVCGNGRCSSGETAESCPLDCEPSGSSGGGDGILGPPGGDGETTESNGTDEMPQEPTLAILGGGTHEMTAVQSQLIVSNQEGLNAPRNLAFKPNAEGELWVINQADHSMTIITDVGTDEQDIMTVSTISGAHFMANPMSLAFGAPGSLATIHETDEITQPTTPADFMGPTLYSSNLSEFDGGHGGHLDMLHNSPNGVGIAWERANIYWIFDGYHSAITRYNFNADHDLGGADHSDGEVDRYIEGEVKRQPGVLSGMVFDHSSDLLYIADTGNNRIIALNTTSGTTGRRITPNYDGTRQNMMDDATYEVVVDGNAHDIISRPSGLVLHEGVLYVSDNTLGRILGFDLDGNLIDYLDTGLPEGALMGIAFDHEGALYFVDASEQEVWKISSQN